MDNFDSSPTMFISSTQRKPQTSITLPRNFAPHCFDGSEEPRTPDQTFAELKLPPPPHHSTLRIRRPRINMDHFQTRNNALPSTLFASEIPIPSSAHSEHVEFQHQRVGDASDVPMPSIEESHTITRPSFQYSLTDPSPSDRLRLPTMREQLPRTPPAQTKFTPPEFKPSIWDMHRSASDSSLRSDSSISSCATFTTRPTSFDGSATSPDLDLGDPFFPHKVNIIPDTPSRKSKKIRVNSMLPKDRVRWSIEMDNHLFNIYQMYLADPSVTPFKTVPGSIPPTGVCHRVARRAKETWPKASRISRPIVKRYRLRNVLEDRNFVRAKTPEPNDFLKTDSGSDGRGMWPSESSTRKRLKQLCREKFTITAHYQRLRESRSPSPFADQFLRKPPSRTTRSLTRHLSDEGPSTTYTTRELGISLVASGATAPLAQLVTGDSPPSEAQSESWFNSPMQSDPDKMNISPPSGLGIANEPEKLCVASSIPRLASPFSYNTWNGPCRSNQQHRRNISQNQFDTMHATGSRLLSPFKVESEAGLNINKRRAQHNLEDEMSPSGTHIGMSQSADVEPQDEQMFKQPHQELVFTGLGDISHRRIRLRSRGATLGSVNNREQIERLFTPPTLQHPATSDNCSVPPVPLLPPSLANPPSAAQLSSSLFPPELDANQKRLGSPFELDPNKRSQRAKNPRHFPSLSDPFLPMSSTNASPNQQASNMSIGERLSMFNSLHQQHHQGQDDPFA